MAMTIEHTGTFSAVSDQGAIYTIFEFTNVDRFRSSSGAGRVDGTKSYRTSDGQDVKWVEKGKYQIVGFDIIDLTSDDPNAP